MAAVTSALILPAHIDETVSAIAELHAQHLRQATPVHRIVERSVSIVGRPRFAAILTLVVLGRIATNMILGRWGRAFNKPPFQTMQDIGEPVGLYIAVLILITQRRENDLTEPREQLTFKLAILCEQKNAKIIELLEESLRDNPLIADRNDSEAEALSRPADPQAVLEAIKESQSEMKASVTADVASGSDLAER